MYTAFAKVYDRMMADVDYAGWAAHYQRLMQQMGVPARGRCVECACGTGSLTLPLRRAGYQMTGVDLSGDMLAEAMEKARAAGLMIPFICQDMTRLSVPRRVDCGCYRNGCRSGRRSCYRRSWSCHGACRSLRRHTHGHYT